MVLSNRVNFGLKRMQVLQVLCYKSFGKIFIYLYILTNIFINPHRSGKLLIYDSAKLFYNNLVVVI